MKKDILNGLVDKTLNTSWYARKDDSNSMEEKCPHPNNAENLKRIELFQAQLKRYNEEKEEWLKIQEYYEKEHGKLDTIEKELIFEPSDIVSYVDPKV